MTTAMLAAAATRLQVAPGGLWLKNRRWDLTWISLSAGLVLLPFAAYEAFNFVLSFPSVRGAFGIQAVDALDVSRNTVNALIALLIGGPHMYATFTRTFLDGDFRKGHMAFLVGSFAVPVGVVAVGVWNFQLLITGFFFWASVHIMHQIAYIIDCYNGKHPRPISLQARVLDYVVVFSSLYPLGVWRMVSNNFKIGQIQLLFPPFMMIENNPALGWTLFLTVTALFVGSLLLWGRKSFEEHKRGLLHGPKFLLMSLTIVVAFFIPLYHELDVAFQGFNTWHSFQYLGLTLYVNQVRGQNVRIQTRLIRNLSQVGKGWRFYAFTPGCSLATIVVIAALDRKSVV